MTTPRPHAGNSPGRRRKLAAEVVAEPAPPVVLPAPLRIHLPFLPVPYVRIGRERWTDRAKRYEASQDEVRALLVSAARAQGWPLPWPGVYRVAVAVVMPPTVKSTKQKRGSPPPCPEPPSTGGDWDNYLKAVVDAAADRITKRGVHLPGVTGGDGPNRFAGPAPGHASGIFLGETPGLFATFVAQLGHDRWPTLGAP